MQYSGFYVRSFEVSSFHPCSSEEQWYAIGEPLTSAYLNCGVRYGDSAYVVLYGTVSPPGSYGHLGGWDRKFYVSEVFEMRLPQTGDCK